VKTNHITKLWNEYIEIAELCGPKVKKLPATSNLDGHIIMVVRSYLSECTSRRQTEIIFWADLTGKELTTQTGETNDQRLFAIGNIQNTKKSFKMTFSEAIHINSKNPSHKRSIPPISNDPTAIILLHLTTKTRRDQKSTIEKLKPTRTSPDSDYTPRQIDSQIETFIKTTIVDMFIYGLQFQGDDVINFRQLYAEIPEDLSLFMFSTETEPSSDNPTSFSRCGNSNVPFLPISFKTSKETPGETNDCKRTEIKHPFPARFNLQRTAMWLVLNLQHTLKQAVSDPSILDGAPREVASKLLGISKKTITRINNRLKDNQLLTPSKRNRKSPVLSRIDNFDRDWIQREIVKSYANNIAPNAKLLYDAFMIMKRCEDEEDYRKRIEPTTTTTQATTTSTQVPPTTIQPSDCAKTATQFLATATQASSQNTPNAQGTGEAATPPATKSGANGQNQSPDSSQRIENSLVQVTSSSTAQQTEQAVLGTQSQCPSLKIPEKNLFRCSKKHFTGC